MKAKVLIYRYDDGSGSGPVRVYLETQFDQAEKDLEMLTTFASDRQWYLTEVEVFGNHQVNQSQPC